MKDYIVNGPVRPEMVTSLLAGRGRMKNSGGHSLFLGQVREDVTDNKRVIAIEYSVYEEMITTEAEKIIRSVMSDYEDVTSVDIIHSKGTVYAGEISLLVFVSAGHRKQAMDACRDTVELIKERLPVWKKEIFDDQSGKWK